MNVNWFNWFFIVLIFGGRGQSSCENGIINQLFDEEETLIYILNDTYHHSNNPKLIFANYKAVRGLGKISDYIIQVPDEYNLIRLINDLQKTALWDAKKSPKRHFLIFMNNVTTPQLIFDFAKTNNLINVLIIQFLLAESFAIYYPETYCDGAKFTKRTHTCHELDKVHFERNVNILRGCELSIFVATALPIPYVEYNKSKEIGFLIRPLFFLEQMYDWKLNYTTNTIHFQFLMHENIIKDFNGSDVFACEIRLNITDDYRETTNTILYENFLWLLPMPKKKSNVKVLVTIYNYTTWILMFATFFFVALLHIIIDIFLNQRRGIQRNLLDIIRLNLGSGIQQMSQLSSYRVFLISYIIYCLHVNCFYQGKLSAVLTSANYERHIRNMEDLYQSNLHLIAPNITSVRWRISGNLLAKKFADRVEVYVKNFERDTDVVLKDGNTALLTKSLKTNTKDLQLVDYFSNTLSLTTQYAYGLLNGSYYIPLFNNMIRITNENGFLPKWINDIHRRYRLPKLNDNAILTLNHLTGAFIILFTGLSLGFVIFLGEIMGVKLKRLENVEN